MVTQPTETGEREAFLLEFLCAFFRFWPVPWMQLDTPDTYQEKVVFKARDVRDYLQFMSVDRSFLVPDVEWREWVTYTPRELSRLAGRLRDEHVRNLNENPSRKWVRSSAFAKYQAHAAFLLLAL